MIQKSIFVVLVSLVSSASVLADSVTLIHAGTLLAVPGEAALENQTIVIDCGKVSEVRDGFVDPSDFPDGAELVNLSDQFVMPGLMDMHVHLQGQMGPSRYRDRLKLSDADVLVRTIHYGMNTLMAGFTTVRDVGNSGRSHVRGERMESNRD